MVLKVANGGLQNGPSAFQGSWDANANSPFLQSGVGFSGEYYIVSVAGNTTLDGNTNWKVGDWAIFNGATNQWEKISGGAGTNGIQIITDTTSNTNYNITLTSASSGNITTEYVDPTDLSFNPSTKTLKATNANVTGNLTASNATITNLTATNGNITNFSSSNATITGGTISNTTLSNVTGGSINVVNDSSSNTTYYVMMSSSSGGNVANVYVDSPGFNFVPGTGDRPGQLSVSSARLNGYVTIAASPTSNNVVAWECYDSPNGHTGSMLSLYTTPNGSPLAIEPVAFNGNGWLGIGIDTSYDVFAPLQVSNAFGGSTYQVFITDNPAQSSTGLFIQSTTGNATINSSGNINIASGNNAHTLGLNTNGAVNVNGGYGTSGQVIISAGSGANAAWGTLASGNISGLGTMATQNANAVVITGGSISNVAIGAAITTKSAAYTATANDETILANVSAGAFAITLPTAVGATGKTYIVKKIDSSANSVTVNTTSSQTIDGATSRLLTNQYDAIQVQGDGSNWFIIANTFGRNGTAGTF